MKKTLLFCCLLPFSQAHADSAAFALCAKKFANDDAGRLRCFDGALAAPADTVTPAAPLPVQAEAAAPHEPIVAQAAIGQEAAVAHDKRSYLTRVWNLDNRPRRDPSGIDRLQPHRQSYLILRESSSPNRQPSSPGLNNTVLKPYDLDAMEAKFQLSFKTDIGAYENIDLWGLKTMRIWGAYTQQSNWQMFNTRNSSPFRETNYEPELIATFGTGNETGWKLLNLGMVHQSNGRSNPESRSWNRLYAQGGWEWGSTSLLARGWWRVPENSLKDDNPDIQHYMGRGDLVLRWEPESRSQSVSLLLRNNLNVNQNLGYTQIDWSTPFRLGHAGHFYTQISSGYGESLIDYNHRQTTFGLGISFREW